MSKNKIQPLGDIDLHLFAEGNHHHLWQILGAHWGRHNDTSGCRFTVWAPNVRSVSVTGDFNHWDKTSHPMTPVKSSGIWELFIPGIAAGSSYKYAITTKDDRQLSKTDPFARQMLLRPETVSCVPSAEAYSWQDNQWLKQRKDREWLHSPLSIYELHVGSWRQHDDGSFYNWRELAAELIPYVTQLNYTHIELLPISEHPLDASWGYQVSGYYAPTARYGSPDDFRWFIDQCHQAGLGVFLDWVPAHFPKDDFALANFIGEPLYEYADTRKGEHKEWGTLVFDYSRHEVRNFLLANALYWIEEFHIDGLRVDAVAAMLHLDYARESGQWVTNQYGGRENLDAVQFLQELNRVVHEKFPGVLTMAEESTSWPGVSRPVEIGGLGFSMKWNMGWMNDNLEYMQQDPVYRKYHHNKMTFSQMYAWTENFVLPLSHDEVVHLKRSMLDKMPGDYWQKFANLRLFYAWHYAHPGKKLLFMGGEFGQWTEWNEAISLDWTLTQYPAHDALRGLLRDLNALYRDETPLHELDFNPEGFRWIDCNDSEQSVLSMLRFDKAGNSILAVFNFTPVVREQYRIGVPQAGIYREILNTDSEFYGGSNCGNYGELMTQDKAWMGLEQSLELTLPPLGALYLRLHHQTLVFSVNINAPAEQVWETMWEPERYKQWAKGFSANSQYSGGFKQGGTITFFDPDFGGTRAVLDEILPAKRLQARHIAIVNQDGSEDTTSEDAKAWYGVTETYELEATNGNTLLTVTMNAPESLGEMLAQGLKQSLDYLLQLCEAEANNKQSIKNNKLKGSNT
ncbi:MAG: 1,4-alpha-glucan branching protein GlgB [Thiolinea sp.]